MSNCKKIPTHLHWYSRSERQQKLKTNAINAAVIHLSHLFSFILLFTSRKLWWFGPGHQPSTHRAARTHPMEENRKSNSKLLSQDKHSLIAEWKRGKMPQNKQCKSHHSPCPTHQLFSEQQPPQKQNTHHSPPTFFPCSGFYCWAWRSSAEYPLGQFRSAAPAVSPPNLLSQPTLRGGRQAECGKRRKSQSWVITVQL